MISELLLCGTSCWTALCCGGIVAVAYLQWLMGPSAVSDVELDDGSRVKSHGVKVERCRVLERSGGCQVSGCRVYCNEPCVSDNRCRVRQYSGCCFGFRLKVVGFSVVITSQDHDYTRAPGQSGMADLSLRNVG